MALPLQIEPMVTEWAPRPVRLHVVHGGPALVDEVVYRRRRIAAAVLSVVLVAAFAFAVRVGVAVLGGDPASAPEPRLSLLAEPVDAPGTFGGQTLVPGGVYVVQPGDTFWALARALQPEGDVSSLVRRLVRANGGPELAVGDRVVLPG